MASIADDDVKDLSAVSAAGGAQRTRCFRDGSKGVNIASAASVKDRRASGARMALVRRVMDEVFARRWFTVGNVDCTRVFGISPEICQRILAELERAGVVRQVRPGTWVRQLA